MKNVLCPLDFGLDLDLDLGTYFLLGAAAAQNNKIGI
jgi:hypothetical protein